MNQLARLSLALVLLLAGIPAAQAQQGASAGGRVLTLVPDLEGGVGGVAVDRLGYVYVADFGETVYKITPDGRTSVFARGIYGASGNTVDAAGNLIQSNFSGHRITRIDRLGNQEIVVSEGLAGPVGVVEGEDGDLFVCNCQSNSIGRATPGEPARTFAEGELFACPNGITRGPDGDLYVVNFSDGRMIRVTPDGEASEFARIPGGGNGHITWARGAFYVTAFQTHRVFRVTPNGEVTLFAGTGAMGEDDGPFLEATFTFPNGIAANPAGDRLYINDFLNRTPPTVPIPPTPRSSVRVVPLEALWQKMVAALRSGGIEAMRQTHDAWKSDPATAALFTEIEINALGYNLLTSGQVDAAIAVLELNVEAYPNSFNTHDSLGEALAAAGRVDEAIASYERSLEIDPGNANAREKLLELRGR